jgi:hypothetical protein
MTAHLSPYEYFGNVGRQQIRVLLIHPDKSLLTASGQRLPHFTLKVVSLAEEIQDLPNQDPDAPPMYYSALSYVWGDQSKLYPIAMDYALFEVGENLFAAIAHLLKNFPPPYWIDAICINQNNLDEKGIQIVQMGEVYRKAKRVLVWLGPGDAQRGKVIAQVNEMGKRALETNIEMLTAEKLKQWPEFGADEHLNSIRTDLEKVIKSSPLNRGFHFGTFLDIMDNAWFGRAWIVQELSVARRDSVEFVCGFDQIPYENLAAGYKLVLLWYADMLRSIQSAGFLASRLYQLGNLPRPPSARAGTTLGFRKKYLERVERLDYITWKELLTSSYTLDSAEDLQCKDLRDRVYALVAMTNDNNAFLGPPQNFYKRTLQELYISVAEHLLSDGHMDILGLCRSPDRDPHLPSWVPDWSHPIRPPWSLYKEDKLFPAQPLSREDTLIHFSGPPNTLTLHVWLVDSILEVGADCPFPLSSFSWSNAKTLIADMKRFLAQSQRYTSDVAWRIPIGNKEQNTLMQTVPATNISIGAYEEMEKELPKWRPRSRFYGVALTSYVNMMWSMYECKVFISKMGYVGLCPATAKLGDGIYRIAGGHVPYVFRKVPEGGGEYTLVGEAYVEEIRLGEFAESPGADGKKIIKVV